MCQVPVLFLVLLLASSNRLVLLLESSDRLTRIRILTLSKDHRERLARATSFLHAEYRPEMAYFELVELMRKLALTGFLLFIEQSQTLLRIVFALLISILYIALLQTARPFKSTST